MRLQIILFLIILTGFSAKSQSGDPITQKASFNGADLTAYLSKSALYPQSCLAGNIQGDVVLAFNITKDGTLDGMLLVSSPDQALTLSAVAALTSLEKSWKPTLINDVPVTKKYLTVFRYRMYMNSAPIDYRKEIKRLMEKEKYDKALKVCNTAIKDNKYDFQLYKYRSQVKEKLGDTEGSEKDRLTSVGINDQVMVVINIDVRGVTRKVMVGSQVTRVSR
jgi:hypothetical protein